MAVQRSKTATVRRAQPSNSRHHRRMIEQVPVFSASLVENTLGENLDEETRMAKRHLTKEMWQLVSIAVKRMADEFVSISNNQQTEMTHTAMETTLSKLTNNVIVAELGAGDIPVRNVKPSPKKRTLPMHMLACSSQSKKKETTSNHAKHRTIKSINRKKSTEKTKTMSKQSLSHTHTNK